MSIGCSPYSVTKWERLDYLVGAHARICKIVIEKSGWASCAYHYFDFYAGPGIYSEAEHPELAGQYGSPIRVIKILERILPCRLFLFDQHQSGRLQTNLRSIGVQGVVVGSMSCAEAVDSLLDEDKWSRSSADSDKSFGLAFFDPNGPPDWDAIRRFASFRLFDRIDILINVNSANCKWCHSSRLHPESLRPTEHLVRLGKKSICLWDPTPSDRHQFALAYCTNGPITEFKNWGFRDMNSTKGQAIQRRIDYAARERRLFGPQPGHFPGFEWM